MGGGRSFSPLPPSCVHPWIRCLCIVWVFMQCWIVVAVFGCRCIVWVFMQCSVCWFNVLVLMQRLGVDTMFRCWCNVRCQWYGWAFMHCSGVDVMFRWWCNVRVFMHFSGVDAKLGVDALFWCWCNVQVLIHCAGVYAMIGCWCQAWK